MTYLGNHISYFSKSQKFYLLLEYILINNIITNKIDSFETPHLIALK